MDTYVGDDFMIAWDTAPPRVSVGVWPDNLGWSDEYALTTGCCDASFLEMDDLARAQSLLNLAADMVLGDGIEPKAIMREFAKIRVWRDMGIILPSGHYRRAFLQSDYSKLSPHNPH